MNLTFLNPLRWRKSFLLSLLAGFLVIWFGFLDTYSLYTRYQLKRQKEELLRRTTELQLESQKLNEKIEDLKENADQLEKIAREDYGMRKKGETVYRVKKEKN